MSFFLELGGDGERLKILYVGGLDANQKGAVGTHTAGIIGAFKENENIEVEELGVNRLVKPENLI